ncbi:MAG: transporter substrate-binding domain-containing protein [Bdellovibrionota bacterium]
MNKVDLVLWAMMMLSKNLLLLTTFLFSGTLMGAPSKVLKVGMELAYPPFEMTDKAGKPDGISVGIAKALGKKLNRTVQIENMSFDGLIPALKTGSIDLVISSLTVNEERKKSIDFSTPYVKTGLALLVGSDTKIQNEEDLKKAGTRVAVKKGTTAHAWASKNLPKAKLLVLDKETSAVLEVVQKKADAFIYDQMSVYKHWIKNRNTTRALLKAFQEESWAIGIKKGNKKLVEDVNQFIQEFRKEQGFDNLATEYLGEEKQVFKELGVNFIL